jgi:hypothetical protein
MNAKLALRSAIVGFSAVALSAFGLPAQAANLVTNGDFTATTNGLGQLGYNTNLVGWTSSGYDNRGYNFLFGPGTADTTGVNGVYGNLQLWGPNNGSANGLTATSPAGGNFIAADGAFQQGPISQQLNNLTVGASYVVSFWDAGIQQKNFDGDTTEQWQVSLGSETHLSTLFSVPSHGFSGWKQESLTFTATAASQTLSFLALGTPEGKPPFSLLSGVSVSQSVPEPFTIVGTMVGLGLGARLKSKLNKKK